MMTVLAGAKMGRGPLGVLLSACLAIPVAAAPSTKPQVVFPRDATGRVSFQETVNVEGASASKLYSRASKWVAVTYKSAKDVVQMADKNAGRLIVKGLVIERFRAAWQAGQPDWIRHMLILEVAEGKYHYAITGLGRVVVAYVPGQGTRSLDMRIVKDQRIEDLIDGNGKPRLFSKSSLQYIFEDVHTLIDELKAAMAKPDER